MYMCVSRVVPFWLNLNVIATEMKSSTDIGPIERDNRNKLKLFTSLSATQSRPFDSMMMTER